MRKTSSVLWTFQKYLYLLPYKNNNKMKVSVIVPVYNSKQYLSRCIDSILNQSVTGFELLLIDDGSTDDSGSMCDIYAEKDSRVRVFHKENGGVSSARNLGLDNAKGEWVTFVDSDDWIEEDYFIVPFDEEVDLFVRNMRFTNGEMSENLEQKIIKQNQIRSFFQDNIHLHLFRTTCGFFFKRNVLNDNKIRYNVLFRLGEDTLFVFDYYRYTKSVHILEKSRYVYNKAENWGDKYYLSWQDTEAYLEAFMSKYEALSIDSPRLLQFTFSFYFNMVKNEEKHLGIKWALSEPVLKYRKTLLPQRGFMFKLKYYVSKCVSRFYKCTSRLNDSL